MTEKIDELRRLLDLPDRDVLSIVALNGTVETTTDEDSARRFAETDDRAFVFVGPKDKLCAERRERNGTVTYTFTVHP